MYTSLYGGLQTSTVPFTPAQSGLNQYQDSGLCPPPGVSLVSTAQGMPGVKGFGGSFSQPASPTSFRNTAGSAPLTNDWSLPPLSTGTGLEGEAYQRRTAAGTVINSTPQHIFFPMPQGLTSGAEFGNPESSLSLPTSPESMMGAGLTSNFQLAGPPVSPGLCSICQDRATGKHYGANSCDGCKGFFRRTIRKSQKYTCRFQKNCQIDRDKRNSCRYCRFRKCIAAGMRRDAVQNERDRIISKKPGNMKLKSGSEHKVNPDRLSPTKSSDSPDLASDVISERSQDYIDQLLKAEAICSQLRATVITRTPDQLPPPDTDTTPMLASASPLSPNPTAQSDGQKREATVHDVTNSMHQQLLLMVEWAKTLSPFFELNLDDQIALLRNYAAQHLLICVAHRSRHAQDELFLTNETCLPREPSAEIPDVNHVTVRVLDELVIPIKNINIEESEFVCLRAIVFFNPNARGLVDNGRVNDTRQSILLALNEYVAEKFPQDRCRFGNLLLLLPPLQAIAQNLIEDIQLASLFGMARIDSLLQELLLSEESGRSRIMDLGAEGGKRQFPDDSFFQCVQAEQEKLFSGPKSDPSHSPTNERKINVTNQMADSI